MYFCGVFGDQRDPALVTQPQDGLRRNDEAARSSVARLRDKACLDTLKAKESEEYGVSCTCLGFRVRRWCLCSNAQLLVFECFDAPMMDGFRCDRLV